MDALTFKIVVIGVILIAVGLGTDLGLELTGHDGSSAVPVALKVATAGIGIVTTILAGKAGQGPNPPRTLRALLTGKPRSTPPPSGETPV